jgi:hypothetical protein
MASTTKRESTRLATALVSALVVLAGVVGCSSKSGPSAAQKACDARSNLRSSVTSVVDEVKSANFSQARDGVSQVQSDVDQLRTAIGDLASAEKQELQPKVDQLRTDVANLKDVTSLSQLSSQVSAITTELQALSNQVADSLKCS